jgi:putative acetyltransferase
MKTKADIVLNRVSKRHIDHCLELIRETVHTINVGEYSQSQLDIWSNQHIDSHDWWNKTSQHIAYFTAINNKIIGFGEMTRSGELCHLYVHKDYQAKNIATILVEKLESDAKKLGIAHITIKININAKPFFEILGYQEYKQNQVTLCGIKLTNLSMRKTI